MNDEPYKIRPWTESDHNFVYDAWLRSYRKHADVIPYSVYRKIYQAILDRILSRPEAHISVACNPHRPEQVFGFIAYEAGIVHYIYIKRAFWGVTSNMHSSGMQP